MRRWIPLLLVLIPLTGCTSSAANEQLLDREWTLTWIAGFPTMPPGVSAPTARFGADGQFGGNTACNSAGASYTVSGDRLDFDAVIATKRACADRRGNALEREYLQAIANTTRYRIADGHLELLDRQGTVLARFD